MSKSRIVIVNENDDFVCHKERGTLKESDIYRVSGLWIQNSKGDVLLAQRSFDKKNSPGKWGPAVAGTVEEGESYESNIIKEAEEEIGLRNCSFRKSFYRFTDNKHRRFVQWFFAVVDKELEEFVIQEEEVEEIKWFAREELIGELESFPDKFIDSVGECLNFFEDDTF